MPGLPPIIDAAIMKALAVRATDRFQSIDDFQNALMMRLQDGPVNDKHQVTVDPFDAPPEEDKEDRTKSPSLSVVRMLALAVPFAVVTLLLFASYCFVLMKFGFWMYEGKHLGEAQAINVCSFIFFATLFAVWLFMFPKRSRKQIGTALGLTVALTALCWNGGLFGSSWNSNIAAFLVVLPVLLSAELLTKLPKGLEIISWSSFY